MEQNVKLDLHCHLDGSLPLSFMQSVLGEQQVTEEDVCVDDNCADLAEYLGKFTKPLQCLGTPGNLKGAALAFMRSLQEDNLDYVEARFDPMTSAGYGIAPGQVIESVLEGMEAGKKETGIEYNVIVCAMRHHTMETNLAMIRAAREFYGNGVCAVDLAGDENAFPTAGFRELFAEVKRLGMPFTLHAGECGSVAEVVDSVEMGACRIGHGTAMAGHPDIQQMCVKKGIGVEMCPISNLQTKAAQKETYPLQEFLANGVCVTVNTDNRTMSRTSISREFRFIRENFGVTPEQERILTENAIRIAFASNDVKQKLYKKARGPLGAL